MDRQQPTDPTMKIINNTYVVVAARMVIGVLFVIASADKIADPAAFATSISSYKLVPEFVALVVATVLPWMELICGVFLVFGVFRNGAGLVLTCLMAIFTVLVISALVRGLDISCGCFTQDPSAARIGWWKVAENTGLFIFSLVPTFSTNSSLSIEHTMAERYRRSVPP